MKPEMQKEKAATSDIEVIEEFCKPDKIFKIKAKGKTELKFEFRWLFIGRGYGNKRTLDYGESFAFIPHEEMGAKAKITKFEVFKSSKDKKAKSHDSETWEKSSAQPDAVDYLKINTYENGIIISHNSEERRDIWRAFEITIVDSAKDTRLLDPELKIKKKDDTVRP